MPPAESQNLHVRRSGGVSVVSFATPYLQSEEDIAKVGAELNALLDNMISAKVLITFAGVRFVSSSMLGQLVKLHRKAAKAKGQLRVCGLAPAVLEILKASHLDKLLDVYDDEAAALAKF